MKSIMQSNPVTCYICGSCRDLTTHHVMHGSANRKKADEDGLTVKLCWKCHSDLHDKGLEDKWLQREGMRKWMQYYSKTEEDFRKRYGKVIV